ncbi:MAG: DUF4169 family protein [Hyphomicrobium sp.]|uniref:DUF4169 family protein n=1 Tax=Hyphomicrobium sp. TaxID=82 RepID=UPI003D10837E
MTAEIVNLRKARKARDRVAKEKRAAENRAKFGRTKAERADAEAQQEIELRRLAAHKREAGDNGNDESGEGGPAP